MKSFQAIQSCFSKAKDAISSAAKSGWNNYYVQGTVQGLAAPFYSYHSMIAMWDGSEPFRVEVSNTAKLNGIYLLQALLCEFIYNQMIHPQMDKSSDYYDSNIAKFSILVLDYTIYLLLQLGLRNVQAMNYAQNFFNMLNLTEKAGESAKKITPNTEFKPCRCGGFDNQTAGIESALCHATNRFAAHYLSLWITAKYPGMIGTASTFALDSLSYGYALMDYKLIKSEVCTKHRIEAALNRKLYCSMSGASLLATTNLINKIFSSVVGVDSVFIHDALFSFIFQLYAVSAIARTKSYPIDDSKGYDVMEGIKYLSETRGGKLVEKHFLSDFQSFENFAKTPAVSKFLVDHEAQIRGMLLDRIKNGIKNIETNRLFLLAKWINKVMSLNLVSDDNKESIKYWKSQAKALVMKGEKLIDFAKIAREQIENPKGDMAKKPIDEKQSEEKKLEPIKVEEVKTASVSSISKEPLVPLNSSVVEEKSDVIPLVPLKESESHVNEKTPEIPKEPVVLEKKENPEKTSSVCVVAKNNSSLFSKTNTHPINNPYVAPQLRKPNRSVGLHVATIIANTAARRRK